MAVGRRTLYYCSWKDVYSHYAMMKYLVKPSSEIN